MGPAQDFIAKYRNFKTLPHVVTKLSKLISDSNTTMRDFEEVIRMDPTLVARLLRLVNSPYYGLTQHIDSIGRAVAFIGMKNLYNIAITDALKNIFSEEKTSSAFSRQRLWLHCATVGICSKMVAERIFGINGDDAYLCGILHDFGLIVVAQVAGDDFIEVCEACNPEVTISELERKKFGTDHCEIGYLMIRDWGMSETIQKAVRDHDNLDIPVEPSSPTGILQVGGYITEQLGYTILQEASPKISPYLADHIRKNSDEYGVLIEDLPEELKKAREIYSSGEK